MRYFVIFCLAISILASGNIAAPYVGAFGAELIQGLLIAALCGLCYSLGRMDEQADN